jgi:UDP-glucose 4-epimerase
VAVFDAARQGKVPVVYASSAAVYGDNPALPLGEDAATRPLSAYGADKLGCELHARVARHVHGVPAIGFRFFNVFGPRQDPKSPYSGVISIFCDRLRAGRKVTIFGDGKQTRDFVYVGDVVRALLAGMERRPADPAVFNVCTGQGTSVLDLAGVIAWLCGVELEVAFAEPRAGEIRASLGDPRRTAEHLGVVAETDLGTGLARTLGLS